MVPESSLKLTWAKTTSFLRREALSADVSVTMFQTSSSMLRSASSAEVVVVVVVVEVVSVVAEFVSCAGVSWEPHPPHDGNAHCSQPACEFSAVVVGDPATELDDFSSGDFFASDVGVGAAANFLATPLFRLSLAAVCFRSALSLS